jgi:signal transduction histidine kinase
LALSSAAIFELQMVALSYNQLAPNMSPSLQQLVHDLRQPLSVIEICAAYLELIADENPRIQAQLDRIRQQVEHASHILASAATQTEPLKPSLPLTNSAISSVMN